MAKPVNIGVLLGGLGLCGAACLLLPPDSNAPITLAALAGTGGSKLLPGITTNLFARFADWSHKKLRDKGAAAKNHDLRDLMATAIENVLDEAARTRHGGDAGVDLLRQCSRDVRDRLANFSVDVKYTGIWEAHVPDYFKPRVEEFQSVRALTPELWRDFLCSAGDGELAEPQRLALAAAANALHERLPRHLVGAYRDALQHHPAVYVAVQTAILQEMWAALSRIDSKTDAFREELAGVRRSMEQIGEIAREIQEANAEEFRNSFDELRVLGWTIEWLARESHHLASLLLPQIADDTRQIRSDTSWIRTIMEKYLPAIGFQSEARARDLEHTYRTRETAEETPI
ncbi:MAG TPA: hypothetical protein VG797_01770 [Phycisphaerales bacterium]|nr:hypothetical protein [Phycisphaerales bacterium]